MFVTRNAVLDKMNVGITEVLGEYSKKSKITFSTQEKYVRKGKQMEQTKLGGYHQTNRVKKQHLIKGVAV